MVYGFVGSVEIIETYWNVNEVTAAIKRPSGPEIIETYWNVNLSQIYINYLDDAEIIETYWNVNFFSNNMLFPVKMK